MSTADRIVGSEKVIAIFGRWPSFHDAEVFEFNLDRRGPDLRTSIYVFAMTSENQSMVALRFCGLTGFAADGFNEQNVLSDLHITDISGEQLKGMNFEVAFAGIYGVTAKFRCRSIEVESVEPMKERAEVQAPRQSPPRQR